MHLCSKGKPIEDAVAAVKSHEAKLVDALEKCRGGWKTASSSCQAFRGNPALVGYVEGTE